MEEVGKELAAARVVLATLQAERDHWRARWEQAELALREQALVHATLGRQVEELERQCAEERSEAQRRYEEELQWRTKAQEAERQAARTAEDLARVRAELEHDRTELNTLRSQWQLESQSHTRLEQEARAMADTASQIGHELASARVVLETLQAERDQWKARHDQIRAAQLQAQDQLEAELNRRRLVDQSLEAAYTGLRQTLAGLARWHTPLPAEEPTPETPPPS